MCSQDINIDTKGINAEKEFNSFVNSWSSKTKDFDIFWGTLSEQKRTALIDYCKEKSPHLVGRELPPNISISIPR